MKRIILCALLTGSSYLSTALIIRHDVDPSSTIVGLNEFRSVLQIKLSDRLGIVQFEGVLIHENWVLTCAHFADEGIQPDQSIGINGHQHKIDSIIIHPGYEGWDYDVALIRLQNPVEGIEFPELFRDDLSKGDVVHLVATGSFGQGGMNNLVQDNIKRKATNVLTRVTPEWLFMQFDAPGTNTVTMFEGISGPGNSGGPALVEKNGKYYIVGIGSHSETSGKREDEYGVTDIFTNVSSGSIQSWILETMSGLDYLKVNEPLRKLINLLSETSGEDFETVDRKMDSKLTRIKKKLQGYELSGIGMNQNVYAVYKHRGKNLEYRLDLVLYNDELNDFILTKTKIETPKADVLDLPDELADKARIWGLPLNRVSLRISDFFSMCLGDDPANSSKDFVQNYYESFPGKEEESEKFFRIISARIDEIRDLEIIEMKKDRGAVRFSSGESVWTLEISVNKTEPYKINGLSITR